MTVTTPTPDAPASGSPIWRKFGRRKFDRQPTQRAEVLIASNGEKIPKTAIQEALVFLGDEFAKLTPTNTPFYGALAEGQLANGQFDAAVSTLDQALKNAHDGWGSWYDPELLRLKAEALSAFKRPASEIEHALKHSLKIAQEQGALFWQFKSAVSLADFYVSLGRVSLARKIIQPLYKTFSANPDLPWFQRATEIISNTER